MLIQLPNTRDLTRNSRGERYLWHDGTRHAPSLGCTRCPDREVCGGLQIDRAPFDCLGFCCHNPADCDAVCRNKPDEFVRRVREVDGFLFDNVPRAQVLAAPRLPSLVPILFHGNKRVVPFRASPAVCLPLYKVIHRENGEARYESPQHLAEAFRIMPDMPVILTGTAPDPPLERWWSLGPQRREAIHVLQGLGIALVTTPNYSLFVDQPRWDDLHNMKRIALVHEEFLSGGLPAALHVNARTDRDWSRWREYIGMRPEVTHIAFEFTTGAGCAERMKWHANELVRLARITERPLHLVVRGGGKVLPMLVRAFSSVTLLETSAFIKTMHRQRATLTTKSMLSWNPSATKASEMLDTLLAENWQVVAASYRRLFNQPIPPLQAAV
ncbi:MAG: hypothetical protein ACRD2G_02630 [Terriglobia bacterium]